MFQLTTEKHEVMEKEVLYILDLSQFLSAVQSYHQVSDLSHGICVKRIQDIPDDSTHWFLSSPAQVALASTRGRQWR